MMMMIIIIIIIIIIITTIILTLASHVWLCCVDVWHHCARHETADAAEYAEGSWS